MEHVQSGSSPARTRDMLGATLTKTRRIEDGGGVVGVGTYILTGPDGRIKQAGSVEVPIALLQQGNFKNLVTDVGDEVISKRLANVATTLPTGMRLGTGTTAVAKNGAGAAIVTYVTGSNVAMDGGFPTAVTKGAGAGWRTQYQAAWAAGVATVNGIAEAVITNESPLTNVAGTAANTFARALLSPVVNKGANDTLTIIWNVDILGAP